VQIYEYILIKKFVELYQYENVNIVASTLSNLLFIHIMKFNYKALNVQSV